MDSMETYHFSTSQKVSRGSVSRTQPAKLWPLYSGPFWDAEGIVLIDYLEHGSTITETSYTLI